QSGRRNGCTLLVQQWSARPSAGNDGQIAAARRSRFSHDSDCGSGFPPARITPGCYGRAERVGRRGALSCGPRAHGGRGRADVTNSPSALPWGTPVRGALSGNGHHSVSQYVTWNRPIAGQSQSFGKPGAWFDGTVLG